MTIISYQGCYWFKRYCDLQWPRNQVVLIKVNYSLYGDLQYVYSYYLREGKEVLHGEVINYMPEDPTEMVRIRYLDGREVERVRVITISGQY